MYRAHSQEQRRYPRIDKKVRFNLRSDEFTVDAESINLSSNGVNCMVDKPIQLMTSLKIVMTLAYEGNLEDVVFVEGNGVVVRVEETEVSNEFKIAIYFNEIEENEQRKLTDFINQYL